MNFLGKEIDQDTINKVRKFMNTPEGNKLKEQLSRMSKEDLMKLMENAKKSNPDINKIKEALNHNPEEILENINKNKIK